MQKKALVIDDDIFCLDVLVEYLSDKEFDITSSLNPTCPMMEQNAAICPMQEPGYDIVLSDNHMPEMTGLEFFEYQRQRGCKVPPDHKALISGDISNVEEKTAKMMGYKVFHKPTPLNLIDSWIDEVLDEHSWSRREESYMRTLLFIVGLLTIGILFSSQLAFSQETITNPQILQSFAKTIRSKQYICQSCNHVRPVGHKDNGLSYEAVCNHHLSYEVLLTPRNDVIVRPIEKTLVQWWDESKPHKIKKDLQLTSPMVVDLGLNDAMSPPRFNWQRAVVA